MKKLFTIIALISALAISACGNVDMPTPTETLQPTAIATVEPTPEPTESVTQDPELTALEAKEYAIYEYIDELLSSPDNPANWSDIGSDVAAWQKKVEEYEDNAIQKAANQFEIAADEAEHIYAKKAMGN